jgi:hypothetical protein
MKKQQKIIKYFLCRDLNPIYGSYHIITSKSRPFLSYVNKFWSVGDKIIASFDIISFEKIFPMMKLEPGQGSKISFREMKKTKGMLIRFIGKKFKG